MIAERILGLPRKDIALMGGLILSVLSLAGSSGWLFNDSIERARKAAEEDFLATGGFSIGKGESNIYTVTLHDSVYTLREPKDLVVRNALDSIYRETGCQIGSTSTIDRTLFSGSRDVIIATLNCR